MDWRSMVAGVMVGRCLITSWVVLVGVMLVTPGESIFFFGRRSLRQVGAPQEASCVPGIYGKQKLVFSLGSRETGRLTLLGCFRFTADQVLEPLHGLGQGAIVILSLPRDCHGGLEGRPVGFPSLLGPQGRLSGRQFVARFRYWFGEQFD